MITGEMLERWRQAKNLATTDLTIAPEIKTALMEMHIEAKALRRDNLRLLNYGNLVDKMAGYMQTSIDEHYIGPDLQERIDDINLYAGHILIDLELEQTHG